MRDPFFPITFFINFFTRSLLSPLSALFARKEKKNAAGATKTQHAREFATPLRHRNGNENTDAAGVDQREISLSPSRPYRTRFIRFASEQGVIPLSARSPCLSLAECFLSLPSLPPPGEQWRAGISRRRFLFTRAYARVWRESNWPTPHAPLFPYRFDQAAIRCLIKGHGMP